MSKWCYNFESSQYEDIDRDGYSITQHEFVRNWDDSEYRREEEEEERRREEEEKRWYDDEED